MAPAGAQPGASASSSLMNSISISCPRWGAAWMPKGSQEEVMTPGKNAKHYLAGALNLATGKIHIEGFMQ